LCGGSFALMMSLAQILAPRLNIIKNFRNFPQPTHTHTHTHIYIYVGTISQIMTGLLPSTPFNIHLSLITPNFRALESLPSKSQKIEVEIVFGSITIIEMY